MCIRQENIPIALLSADGKYVTVQKGDTLSQIAQDYYGGASKYQALAILNHIENPNLIYVGQKIYLSSTSAPAKQKTVENKVVIKGFGPHAEETKDREMIICWVWDRHANQTKGFEVHWEYATSFGIWLTGSKAETEYKYSTYTYPAEATKVRVTVVPVSKTNNKGAVYFTGTKSDKMEYTVKQTVPDVGTPSITISDDLTLTAVLDNVPESVSIVEFEIANDTTKTIVKTAKAAVSLASVSYSCSVPAGGTYKVRCRGIGSDVPGEWSSYSPGEGTRPANPAKPTKCEATSKTSIKLEWTAVDGATKYSIEYTTNESNFDMNDQTTTVSDIKNTQWEITGLESGQKYYFRIKAIDDKNKESSWSEVIEGVIGTGPVAPTTWSSTTTAVASSDEPIALYWVHNSEDGSAQKYAEIILRIDGITDLSTISNEYEVPLGKMADGYPKIGTDSVTGDKTITYKVEASTNDNDKNKTHSLKILTSKYTDGVCAS